MKDTQHIYDRSPLPLDGKEQASCLYDLPQKPDRTQGRKAKQEGKDHENDQQRPPVRIYPLIPAALPDYLKRRRRRKRRGGGGHE